jgi:hypothetical protein
LAALGVGIFWLIGTYVLDWIGVENWVYVVWAGMIVASWLIGGNVMRHWWTLDARKK